MYEHFKGEEVFVKKVLEYKQQALYKQRLILTKFLSPYHQSIVDSIIHQDDSLQVVKFGGFKNSEMQRVIIAPSFYQIQDDDFDIYVLKIHYSSKFEKLNHRDVLGAVMSLGIKREMFGDICQYQGDFYIAIDKKIWPYFQDFHQIKRSKVHLSLSDEVIEIVNNYQVRSFIVSSFRLDKIISSFYKVSRAQAATFIQNGYVKVNHKPVEQINYLCHNNDMISFKGHGRVKFVDCNRQTRSDNYVVEGYFYK